ncbi:CPBP family glutamic-type intramembrane protease [Streptomyces sp. 1222.5]|uniref:CPBP family intramembrane glutamic endopeptidase n=1 Tax=Streptomyces sp. 1222.5 TaxID=1881026 RepID=UPI003EB9E042
MSINYPDPYGPPVVPQDPAPVVPLPFHRLALLRGRRGRWWRPLAGTVVVGVGTALLMMVLVVASEVGGVILDRPTDADDMRTWGSIGDMAVELLSIAIAIPAVLLAARWVQGRPAGSVSSVTGRLRRRWLGLCLWLALPVVVVSLGITFLLPGTGDSGGEAEWVGWRSFLLALVMLCCFVPLQAAAEEYVFRGWLVQAVGSWLRSPWMAVLPQAVLFAAAHGWGTAWGFADLVVFGGVMGLLAVRTGGLEASIALHTLNNWVGMGIAAGIKGALDSDETAADMGWVEAAVDIPTILIYAAAVLWFARRRGIATVSTVAPQAPAVHVTSPHPWPTYYSPLGAQHGQQSGPVGYRAPSDGQGAAGAAPRVAPPLGWASPGGQVQPADVRVSPPHVPSAQPAPTDQARTPNGPEAPPATRPPHAPS